MDHCRVSGSGGMGIHLPGAAHIQFFDNFKDNIIENNFAAALRIRMDDVNKVVKGNTIEVSGGLQVNGQSGAPVTIERTVSRKGHWDGILLNGTQKILVNHAIIREGGGALENKGNVIVAASATDVTTTNAEVVNSKGYGVLIKSGASDFGINEPASSNTLEGDLGGFYMESQ
jgi:hypothetical protein